jgi:hypothetical protein
MLLHDPISAIIFTPQGHKFRTSRLAAQLSLAVRRLGSEFELW